MNVEKTDDSLKSFLFAFKIHIDQFNEVVHDLYQQITEGSKSVDQLFIQMNEQMWNDIEKQRKQLLDDITSIKQDENPSDNESVDKLLHLLQNFRVERTT